MRSMLIFYGLAVLTRKLLIKIYNLKNESKKKADFSSAILVI